jgi:hypothetical protein
MRLWPHRSSGPAGRALELGRLRVSALRELAEEADQAGYEPDRLARR